MMKKLFPYSLTAMLILAVALSGRGGGGGNKGGGNNGDAAERLPNISPMSQIMILLTFRPIPLTPPRAH
jgi:hypothetical protein